MRLGRPDSVGPLSEGAMCTSIRTRASCSELELRPERTVVGHVKASVRKELHERLLLKDVAEHRALEVKDIDALELGRRGGKDRDLVVMIQAAEARASDLADAPRLLVWEL